MNETGAANEPNDADDTRQMTDDERELFDVRERFYSDIAKKQHKNRLDRLKEQVLELSPSDRILFDDWNIDRQLDEKEQTERETEIVSAFDFVAEAEERTSNWNKMVGLSTGYWTIDNMTMGLAPGELTIVAGQTSHGKTLLAVNIGARLLIAGKKIMFVTLEMTHVEITSRFWKIIEMLNGDPDVLENLMLQKNEKLSWKSIPKLVKKAVENGAELVVIDHLHYFTREMENTAEGLGMVTQEFKRASIKYQVPIILISHTRKVEKGKQADISDLRGSSFIAQDADIVLMVSQHPDLLGRIRVELEKNRNRIRYSVGTSLDYEKEGLLIKEFPHTAEYEKAFEQHLANHVEKRSITSTTPKPEPEQVPRPAPRLPKGEKVELSPESDTRPKLPFDEKVEPAPSSGKLAF